jgi:hypothetical protein
VAKTTQEERCTAVDALQYGLIAEEVAKVYPELVIRNESGRIDGVRYDELAPMLLNEMQKQQNKSIAQAKINAAQAENGRWRWIFRVGGARA